jgi:hypothetical protein
MEHRPTKPKSRKPVVFRDGLGRRVRTLDSAGSELEVLCLRPDLSTPAHEAALRERVSRMANVRSGAFARVRAVQRLNDSAQTLALVSPATSGMRLSEVLTTSERLGVALDASAGWAIVLQLVSAVALIHEQAPDVAHGAIAPERLIVTPDARIVVVEHVLGSMLEANQWTQERYWKEQRVAVPTDGAPFDLRSDVAGIGVVALSLVLGRALGDDEYPQQLAHLVESAMATSVTGGREPMAVSLRSWLDRALQIDERRSFASAIEASAELHRLLEETDSVVVPLSLEAFLSRLQSAIERDRLAAAAPVQTPPSVVETPAVEPQSDPIVTATPEITPVAAAERAAEATVAAPIAHLTTEPVSAAAIANPALQSFIAAAPAAEPGAPTPMASFAAAAEPTSFWKEHPWARQAAAAAVLTVVVGLGWAASRSGSEVRAEPSQPVAAATPAPAPVPTPASYEVPAPAVSEPLPEVEIKKTSAPAPAVMAPTAAAVPAAAAVPTGWVVFQSAQDLNVFENGALIGTTRGGRIRLPAGAHQLELANEAIGFRASRAVQVKANGGATVPVELPNGTLSLNATPWAEVLVDGKSVGETPIGNLSISVGAHDVVFRHPELGEQRMTATVTVSGPTRLTADLRK